MKRRLLIALMCIVICGMNIVMGALTEHVNKKNNFTFLKLIPVNITFSK